MTGLLFSKETGVWGLQGVVYASVRALSRVFTGDGRAAEACAETSLRREVSNSFVDSQKSLQGEMSL